MKKTYLNATTSVVSLQNQNVILGISIAGIDEQIGGGNNENTSGDDAS